MKKAILLSILIFANISLWGQYGPPQRISNDALNYSKPVKAIPADLDNDGDDDLVCFSLLDDEIVWFENLDGQGELSEAIIIGGYLTTGVDDVVVIDMNGDGYLDIIGLVEEQVFWFENKVTNTAHFGGINLLPPLSLQGRAIKVVDLDGDSFLDIVVVFHYLEIGWYRSLNGHGNFDSYQILSNSGRYVIEVADLDSDGDLDITTANYVNGNFILIWLENVNDLPDFAPAVVIDALIASPEEIQIADIDGDNDLDIVFTTFSSSLQHFIVKWYENSDGMGNFTTMHAIEDSFDCSVPGIADFDNDNDLDIVMAREDTLSLYSNIDGAGNFEVQGSFFRGLGRPEDVSNTDMNGDGLQDFISVGGNTSAGVEQAILFKNKGNGNFDNPIEFVADADEIDASQNILIYNDINEDRKPELISSHSNYGRINWQEYKNTRLKFNNPRLIESSQAIQLDVADIDNDGDQDIVSLLKISVNYQLVWYENLNGENNFGPKNLVWETNDHSLNFQMMDMENDGDLDIFIGKRYNSIQEVFWLENLDGQGDFSDPIVINLEGPNAPSGPTLLTDVDNDGDNDILAKGTFQDIFWFENINGNFLDNALLVTTGNFTFYTFVDIDGDALKDIIYFSNNAIICHKNLGGSDFDDGVGLILYSAGINSINLNFYDGNDDGLIDIYLLEYSNKIYFYQNLGGINSFAAPVAIPNVPDGVTKMTMGDLDIDGDLDLVTYHNNSESLYYYENFANDPKISGKVFLDVNENGALDAGDLTLLGQLMTIGPTGIATFASGNGFVNFAVTNGIYEIKCFPNENYEFTTSPSIQVEVNDNSTAQEVLFGLKTDIIQAGVTGGLTSAPTRCGFPVPFWLDYHNLGTVPSDIHIQLVMDPLATFLNAVPAPDSIAGGYAFWTFEDVPPTYYGQVLLNFQIAGAEFIGQWITIPVNITATTYDGSSQANYFYGFRSQINCAVDPNDKLVEPDLPEYDNYTLFGDTLDYKIRFQNTGTDTAFVVLIEDFLDPSLDWNSLRVIGTSHPYEILIDQNTGRTLFTFQNILLPDSSTNEIASHGYVHYQIRHRDGLPEYTYIINSAGIYFDYNTPVITNTVENILVSEYPVFLAGIPPSCHGANDGSISVLLELPFFESYTWNNGDSGTSIDSLSAGIYQLSVQLSTGGVLINNYNLTEPDILHIEVPVLQDISCFGEMDGMIHLEVSGGNPEYFYAWNDGLDMPFREMLSPGIYSVTVTDIHNCTTEDSFELIEPEDIELNVITTDITCFGEMDGVIIAEAQNGTPPYTYHWSNNLTQPVLENLSTGNYTLTLSDSNNCLKVMTVMISSPPEIIATVNTTVETGNNMDGSAIVDVSGGIAPYTYSWDFNPDETGNHIENLSAGEYILTISDSNNCTKMITIIIDQITNNKETESGYYFKINPNPGIGFFYIDFDLEMFTNWEIRISDVAGKIVQQIYSTDGIKKGERQMVYLPAGVYNVNLIAEGKSEQTKKVILY